MAEGIRRVVTGHDRNGKAIVLMDGICPHVRQRPGGGTKATLLWVTDETPADVSGSSDRAARTIGVPPPPNGSIFRIVEFPPDKPMTEEERQAMLREMGLKDETKAPPRHPGMHRTDSIDYAVVLEGEIDMLLDDSEVHLRAGDVLIQQGTIHAWANRGTKPCKIAFVLIHAHRPPVLEQGGH